MKIRRQFQAMRLGRRRRRHRRRLSRCRGRRRRRRRRRRRSAPRRRFAAPSFSRRCRVRRIALFSRLLGFFVLSMMAKGAIGEADEFHERFLIGDDVQRVELKGSQMKALVVCRFKNPRDCFFQSGQG